MRTVTFLVLEGVDKGRVYKDLPIPVTIGREEGNGLRLNDERVSRFHAKVQVEDNDIILTDLDSTNGTRVNGTAVQIRRLRPGDQVSIGRSMLLFGTMEEIAARKAAVPANNAGGQVQTIRADELQAASGRVSVADSQRTVAPSPPPAGGWTAFDDDVPPLPQKLTPSQAARLAEILDYLHKGLTTAVENIDANEDGTEVRIGFAEWQTIQAVQMLLARYARSISEPTV
ncbi:Glycogen accumulation regulator GarA [Gemmata sp. SH-PL17]|uniref:FHA domain-containing protein n=1 Tax=Gemmata massiliana TaxID=1210884 RepID=A0A6P2CQJ4_9BACT|nr:MULTISPECIES: FHA domain-containing protein [Gemmata]AMV29553.1 Glycogen accumulation regulator GarA [Gemmata sp. SH-PL17]VTR91308.1 fha domain containing protein : FHA domain containing protein OS=Rhodopirellula maiorica SM1 GN=RMSM_02780 PE=4 SV=1: FHA [Gemmata massiliana]